MKPDPKQTGFTLAEVLMIVVVLTLLITIFAPSVANIKREMRMSATRAAINQLETGCELFFNDHGAYPRTGMTQLVVDLTGMELQISIAGPYGRGVKPTPFYNPTTPAREPAQDYQPGWGFRAAPRNTRFGPYATCEQLEMIYDPIHTTPQWVAFMDAFGNPITYFRGYDSTPNDNNKINDAYNDMTPQSFEDGIHRDEAAIQSVNGLPPYLTLPLADENGFLYYNRNFAILSPGYPVDTDGDGDEEMWDDSILARPRSDVYNAFGMKR